MGFSSRAYPRAPRQGKAKIPKRVFGVWGLQVLFFMVALGGLRDLEIAPRGTQMYPKPKALQLSRNCQVQGERTFRGFAALRLLS